MPGTFRTMVRWSGALAFSLIAWSHAQVAVPGATAAPVAIQSDSTRKAIDSAKAGRSTSDTAKQVLPVFKVTSPWINPQDCREGVESAADCWRRYPDLVNVGIGFPGTRGATFSLTSWQPIPYGSTFYPAWKHSPYRNGGLAPPERFAIQTSGGEVRGIEDIWTPVVPLDTPMTRLDWERGALSMNVFDLRLHRMLSDRVYLAMDYYSTTADSQTYDYQFNVHQPYLGGLGVLGQIYGPIDRDSTSLVLEGVSYGIQATAIRPRIGVWLDTNRVMEAYYDHVKNATDLASPQGPTTVAGVSRPGGADSLQTFLPSSMSSNSEGLVYSESHRRWTSQWEVGHTAYAANEFRSGDSLTGPDGKDELQADIYRTRGTWSGTKLLGQPFVSVEARSESWEGNPVLTRSRTYTTGWTDAQDAEVEIHPSYGLLDGKADAGLGRSSRMDDRVFWLPHYGASANINLPLRMGIEGGGFYRMQDPEWEVLYRSNSARFLYPNPNLNPRADQGYHGSLSWALPHVTLEGGLDFFRSEDAWMPRVLGNPEACNDLADSLYLNLKSQPCSASPTDTSVLYLPDSLALALRNYGEQRLDAWHLGLALDLGNWSLQLRNRFLIARAVTDPNLDGSLEDRSVPARVFKGRLGWKRNLVEDKLKLDLSWDWEWYSTRYAWVPDRGGRSRVRKLDEYLVLDFQAAMRIKTFTLYFRSMNMNHDRYATEPGVHPPGINFRFGVDWTLWN